MTGTTTEAEISDGIDARPAERLTAHEPEIREPYRVYRMAPGPGV